MVRRSVRNAFPKTRARRSFWPYSGKNVTWYSHTVLYYTSALECPFGHSFVGVSHRDFNSIIQSVVLCSSVDKVTVVRPVLDRGDGTTATIVECDLELEGK